jgi:hypothetical protein
MREWRKAMKPREIALLALILAFALVSWVEGAREYNDMNVLIDELQHAAWLVREEHGSDAYVRWYESWMDRVQEIECRLYPWECQ